ncbi:MAG: sulfite exporter TauE/SafE family protein [candidate division Zixibacteria bacterium]|nr:sulfite exporter TauE/SafE family protein [candidate division Zixibacteria bacterium]
MVIAAGFACGFINTLAGSGSLISLPLLIFLGLPANIANGTNRVAIMLQNTVGVWRFHRAGVLDWRKAWILAIPTILGAIVGAQIAVNLDEQTMRRVIGAVMVIMLVVMIIRPKRWLEGQTELTSKRPGIMQMLVFFAIGIHGGFIQAGVGVFLLAGLVLGAGFDLVRGNAIKLFIILLFTAFALAIFVANDQVVWSVGLIMAIGNMSGAWIGARTAVKRGAGFVRWVLMAVVVVSAVLLLDIPALIRTWFNL